MKALVPDFAMVPRLLMRSALVIPIPVSIIVSVRSCLLGMTSILRSFPLSSLVGSVRLSYLILSRAYNIRNRNIFNFHTEYITHTFSLYCTRTYIRGIGNKLPEKDLLVGIKSVDDEGHQLSNLRLEGKGLSLLFLAHFFRHLTNKTNG